ncbi:hypothetical protein [Frateuria soli]|uniref:hypothetical protein n=1 Tax=Frateuria soli TaxID=1542730 RepID=UPI001E56E9C9|nr:hypothetical protein [Frateuria soli]UGB37758.1 hypothetical protein LQ771_13170 [Frateuria soli]
MHKTLIAAFIGASVFAVPAFAQVVPQGAGQASAHGSARAGTTAPGLDANADTGVGAGAAAPTTGTSGTQPLGLGGLLKQTQAADAASEGTGPTGDLNSKAREKRRAAHGH